jgi:tryptophan synthase alpha chain
MPSGIPTGRHSSKPRRRNIMLEAYLKSRLEEKDILLMTHIVLGYPSLEDSFEIVKAMVAGGVDLMELQIPFSEPIADGPVILRANQKSLAKGSTVRACLDFAENITTTFDIPFLFMTYYNILFKYGIKEFASAMAQRSLRGAIVPDLPPEEGTEYLEAMDNHGLAPIFIFSPTTPSERMQYLASFAKGFVYCVARKGVTGADTTFSDQLGAYLGRCRKATNLPLALGFGVKEKSDIDYLKGKADIAVIGTQTIRLVEKEGVGAVRTFIESLR